MNRKKKILLILFLLFLLITILRETEVVTLDLFKSDLHASSNIDWSGMIVRPLHELKGNVSYNSYVDIPHLHNFRG